MDTKYYERLLAIVMEKLNQTEIEKNWLQLENKQLKDRLEVYNEQNRNNK